MSRDHERERGHAGAASAPKGQRSAGKQTLTQRLASKLAAAQPVATTHAVSTGPTTSRPEGALDDPFGLHLPWPVQAKASAAVDPEEVLAHAARGVDGPGQALPHQATIQSAFGHHDVSGVRAHVGGAAHDAATAIGAEAYATGDDVAFARAPDLHTAAHEAAHVVQQRAGVQLYGGVGEVGDRYERHADEVADGVVAGRPVAALLDTGASGSAITPAVQRSPDKTAGTASATPDLVGALAGPQATTDAYAARHWHALREAARSALLAADLAWDPPLMWNQTAPADRIEVALASLWPVVFVRDAWDPALRRDVDEAIELGLSIGTARQAQVAADSDRLARYHPAIGTAVGNTVVRRLERSMRELGADYLATHAAGGGMVDTSRLPVASTSDRAAVALLAFVQVMGPVNRPRPTAGRRGRKPAPRNPATSPVDAAADGAVEHAAAEAAADRASEQLQLLVGLVGESNLDALTPAYAFVTDGPGASPDAWRAAVVRQAQQLEQIRGEVLALVALSHRDVPQALKADAVAAFARAAGGAHTADAGRLLQRARDEVADLDRLAAMSSARAEARVIEARDPARIAAADLDAVEARADRATRGEGPVVRTTSADASAVGAPTTVTDPAPSPRDDAHASRVETFRQGALRVGDALADARTTLARARELVGGMFTAAVAQDCDGLDAEIAVLEGFLHQLTDDTMARATGGVALVENAIIAEAESRFREFVTSSGILDLGRRVQATLERVESAVRIVQTVGFLVVMLGAAVAGGLAGAYVGGLVRGALTAAGTEATTGAVVAGATAAVATESVVVGGVQTVITGDSFDTAAGENMLAAGLTFGALSGVRGLRILAGARSAWASGATIRFLGPGALDLAIGLGANHAATSLLRPGAQASDDLFLESTTTATSVSLGRLIGARLRGLHARLDALGARHGHDLRLKTELATLRRELLLLETNVPTDPTPPDQLDALVDGQVTPLVKRVTELEQQSGGYAGASADQPPSNPSPVTTTTDRPRGGSTPDRPAPRDTQPDGTRPDEPASDRDGRTTGATGGLPLVGPKVGRTTPDSLAPDHHRQALESNLRQEEIDALWQSGGEPAMLTLRAMVPDQRRVALDVLGPERLGNYASRLDAPTTRAVTDLASTSRVRGIDDWVAFTAGKSGADLKRAAGELAEARRLLDEHPGQAINIGGDGRAPVRASNPGERMRSFDITVETAGGDVLRSVEVTTVDNPVSQRGDITNGVRHAADKAHDRANPASPADTSPIPGQRDVTIRMVLDVGDRPIGGGRVRRIIPDGTVRIIDADGHFRQRRGNPTNLFDDFADNLPAVGNIQHLDRVTLTNTTSGAVLAEYERQGTTWTRIR